MAAPVRAPDVDERSRRGAAPGGLRVRAFRRALGRVCPQCGRGPLFARYGRLRPSCPACGLVYRREQGAQTGSMYVSAAVTQLFAALVIALVWIGTDWGVGLSLAVALPVVGAFCFLFLPYGQALWVAVEYVTDAGNREEWVRPEERPPEHAEDARRARSGRLGER